MNKLPPHLRRKSVADKDGASLESKMAISVEVSPNASSIAGLSMKGTIETPQTTKVMVKIGFVYITDINTIDGTIQCKFYLDMWWHDPMLVGAKKGELPEGTWFPDAYLINAIEKDMDRKMQGANLMDPSTGLCLNAIEYEGLLLVNLDDLNDFPFDEHALLVWVHQAEKQSRAEYVFRPYDPEDEACRLFYQPSDGDEFELRGFTWDAFEDLGGNGIEYSALQLRLCATRRPWYYLFKIVLPLFLCTMFCFSSMFFPVDDLSSRMSVITTMFLATSALMYVLASSLPRTAKLTIIDKYLISTLLLQLLVGVESWIVYDAFGTIEPESKMLFDRITKWLLPSLFILSTLVDFGPATFRYVFITPHSPPRWLEDLNKNKIGGNFSRFVAMKNLFPQISRVQLPTLLKDRYLGQD